MDKTGRAPGSAMEPELQEFHTGAAVHAYRTFGCHALPGAAGHRFAVWAPHAQRVALVGDFNGWDAAATPMCRGLFYRLEWSGSPTPESSVA